MTSNSVVNLVDQQPDWPSFAGAPGQAIRKIVLGRTPGESGEDKKPLAINSLPPNFGTLFPYLTHLYLWNIQNLSALPKLPPNLECLDVRGCPDLASLPELPATLETLDVGDCTVLATLPVRAPSKLKYFYFNNCTALEAHWLVVFLESLKTSSAPIEEIDGSESPELTSLAKFPLTHLRKLVLKNCVKLADITAIALAKDLEHLNLAGCQSLTKLPALPDSIRYLELKGADHLADYLGQGISGFDLGGADPNVARRFQSRKKYGGQLALMPNAKLLFLGDGRVGKTTLSKRLRWEEMDEATRKSPAGKAAEPVPDERYTHRIQMSTWNTGLMFNQQMIQDIEARVSHFNESAADASKIVISKTGDKLIKGNLRIWDFGGQDIYHQTHKVFAREGTVFLIVWCPKPHGKKEEPPDGVGAEEFAEYNRKRPLEYWWDYVKSLAKASNPDGQRKHVALVCTGISQGQPHPPKPAWANQEDIRCFYVDSLEPDCGQNPEYQALVAWIKQACAERAYHTGVVQPRFFEAVSDRVDAMMQENQLARDETGKSPHGLKTWPQWSVEVRDARKKWLGQSAGDLVEDDIITITDYLDAVGNLFCIRSKGQRAVLVDQPWATELIYEMLRPGSHLFWLIRKNAGWFTDEQLREDWVWKNLSELDRCLLTQFMVECGLLARMQESGGREMGGGIYLAVNKWLLPEYTKLATDTCRETIAQRCHKKLESIRQQPGMEDMEILEISDPKVAELDFRQIFASLASYFASTAIYYRNGLTGWEHGSNPSWFVSVTWKPEHDHPNAYMGTLSALICTRRELLSEHAEGLKDLIFSENGPLAAWRSQLRKRAGNAVEWEQLLFSGRRPGDYDLGISNTSQDHDEVMGLKAALETHGFKVLHYQDERCRQGENRALEDYMEFLSRQTCLLLFISEDYLRLDVANVQKCYCAYELADAILQVGTGRQVDNGEVRKRSIGCTPVVIRRTSQFQVEQLSQKAGDLIRGLEAGLNQKWGGMTREERKLNPGLKKLQSVFEAALEPDNFNEFMRRKGNWGAPYHLDELKNSNPPFATLIEDLKKHLPPKGWRPDERPRPS